jgi:hypothetical protein
VSWLGNPFCGEGFRGRACERGTPGPLERVTGCGCHSPLSRSQAGKSVLGVHRPRIVFAGLLVPAGRIAEAAGSKRSTDRGRGARRVSFFMRWTLEAVHLFMQLTTSAG